MYIFAAFQSPNFWTVFPSILWIGFLLMVLLLLRKQLSELIKHFIIRVRAGAPMKIGYVEFGAIQTEQLPNAAKTIDSCAAEPSAQGAVHPADNALAPEAVELDRERQRFDDTTRRVMVVHRLFRSTKPGQAYDVLIYLVPRHDKTLIEVTGVEYFFGRYWNNEVFKATDRSRGFPILTSAYGTFLCCARVSFNDDTTNILCRYIDFEMGAYAPVLVQKDEESKQPAAA